MICRVVWLLAFAAGLVGGLVAFPLGIDEGGSMWLLPVVGIPTVAVMPWPSIPFAVRVGAAVAGIAVAFGMLAIAASGYST